MPTSELSFVCRLCRSYPTSEQAFYSILPALLQRKFRLLLPMSSVHSRLSPALAATPTSTSNRHISCATYRNGSRGIRREQEPQPLPRNPMETLQSCMETLHWNSRHPASLPHWGRVTVFLKARDKVFMHLKGAFTTKGEGEMGEKNTWVFSTSVWHRKLPSEDIWSF